MQADCSEIRWWFEKVPLAFYRKRGLSRTIGSTVSIDWPIKVKVGPSATFSLSPLEALV